MADNPLEDDPEREHRIRVRAYHLWDDEGRPHGRSGEFWERARELVAIEDSAGAGQLPNPQTTGEDPDLPEGIEEAFLQENLGEFPGPYTDQGDRQETPEDTWGRHDTKAQPEAVTPPKPAKKTTAAKKPAAPKKKTKS